MADLRAALEDSGLEEVTTQQAAGNVLFDQGERSLPDCAALIRRTVCERFGHDLPVITRSHQQLADALGRNPYIGSQEGRWVMTVFLLAAPQPRTNLDPMAGAPDEYVVDGAEVFVRYASGVAGSKLQSAWFEKRLGVTATARNAHTVAKLVELSA